MTSSCGKIGRVWWMAAMVVCVAATSARAADLTGAVTEFLTDYDRLVADHAKIDADRDQMSTAINNDTALRPAVRQFFLDREDANATRFIKAVDRKQMRMTLQFKGDKIVKPTKGTGVLATDAGSYITNYDGWKLQQAMVVTDIDSMRSAIAASDTAALTTATTAFFTDSRLRLQKRLQWQMDIRSMKKDVTFKGTGKPNKPVGATLIELVTDFLADRAAFESTLIQLDADRNGIRSGLSGSSTLVDAVNKFLTTRRLSIVECKELALDRDAMRKELKGKHFRERKLAMEVGTKDLDQDEEDGALDESADASGD